MSLDSFRIGFFFCFWGGVKKLWKLKKLDSQIEFGLISILILILAAAFAADAVEGEGEFLNFGLKPPQQIWTPKKY